MSPYDEFNTPAGWLSGIAVAAVVLYKMFFNLRADRRTDHEAAARQDILDQLRADAKERNDFLRELSLRLDEEIVKRRIAEEACAECVSRQAGLLRRIRELGGS